MDIGHPEVYKSILHFVTYIAVPIHIFGTYCILFKTPKSMGSGKWILFNFHLWSMFLDYGVTVLAVPYMLFPALAGIPFGILKDIVPWQCLAYTILSLIPVVSVSVVTMFENRYFIVFASDSKWKKYRIPLSFLNYFFAFTWSVPSFFTVPDQTMARRIILETLGDVPDDIRFGQICVLALDPKYLVLSCFILCLIIIPQALTYVTLMQRGMKKLMKTTKFSESTLKMQKNFLQAIYIQVSVFMTIIENPIGYLFVAVLGNIYSQAGNNLSFLTFSLNGLLSTIVMIWIHKPYRDFCYKLLRIERFKKAKVQIDQGTIISIAPMN